jgi:hypothetical protein
MGNAFGSASRFHADACMGRKLPKILSRTQNGFIRVALAFTSAANYDIRRIRQGGEGEGIQLPDDDQDQRRPIIIYSTFRKVMFTAKIR